MESAASARSGILPNAVEMNDVRRVELHAVESINALASVELSCDQSAYRSGTHSTTSVTTAFLWFEELARHDLGDENASAFAKACAGGALQPSLHLLGNSDVPGS